MRNVAPRPAAAIAMRLRATAVAIAAAFTASAAHAGGGFFIPTYGGYATQMAGTATAIGMDGLAASANPGKLFEAGNRVDFGIAVLELYRRIDRQGGPDPSLDFSTTSHNGTFFVPQTGFAHRLGNRFAFGLAMYGNGGLNTAFPGNSGVPASNRNPAACGAQPANFIGGCGELGIDLNQLIVAPTFAWHFARDHSVGIAPLIAYQRFRAYGFESFEPTSLYPGEVTDNGYSQAFGLGVRVGWYGDVLPRLSLGAAYATRVYMQRFARYRGLLAGDGRLDIPSNYSLGLAFHVSKTWDIACDVQRIEFHSVPALGNGLLNTLQNPSAKPLGSGRGSGFNWRNEVNYKLGTVVRVRENLSVLAGLAYGLAPPDKSLNSVSVNVVAPTPTAFASAGFNWWVSKASELQFAYSHAFFSPWGPYKGPSAIVPGAQESFTAHVDILWVGMARKF